jgi:hypothetical protein
VPTAGGIRSSPKSACLQLHRTAPSLHLEETLGLRMVSEQFVRLLLVMMNAPFLVLAMMNAPFLPQRDPLTGVSRDGG